jgi:glucose dehydrogenase
MMRRTVLATLLVIAVAAGAACGADQQAVGRADATVPVEDTSNVPTEVSAHATDWPLPGRDYANSRATTDSPIDASNVGSLAEAWRADISGVGTYGNASTTPIVMGDTVYLEDLSSKVHAIDLATGAERWAVDLSDDGRPVVGPNGVAVGDGLVFAVAGSGAVAALDPASGAIRWRQVVADTPSTGVDIQPTVYGGLVYVSTVPISLNGIYKGGDRGILKALHTDTGEVAWQFDTVDSPDLWGNPSINSGGGAWYPPAIDPTSGTMYWGIGNPAPFPGTEAYPSGSSRPGPNLYTNTTLALDALTGELRWYQQAKPHDIFDHDHQLALLATTDDGPVVVGTGKDGVVYGLDPASGEVRWKTPVGLHMNDELTVIEEPTLVAPGNLGGVETPPATADGIVYLPVVNAPSTYENKAGTLGTGGIGAMEGEIVAVDAATGAIVWDTKVPGDPFGGATVVNDLVFTGLQDGTLLALSTDDGHLVWTFQAEGTINAWPAVVGDQLLWPLGGSKPPALLSLRLQP